MATSRVNFWIEQTLTAGQADYSAWTLTVRPLRL
jgi:hypothetical protein